MLCGDEVNAAVIDIGSMTSRFGTAGQDAPRHVFRSDVGQYNDESGNRRNLIGDSAFRLLREDLEARPIDAQNKNWEDIENLITYGISSGMQVDPKDYALMFAQGRLFREQADQEKLLEICFEKIDCPSMFAMPSSTMSSFCLGRATSLVVDLGAGGTTITPVVDGYELKKAIVNTEVGGNYVDRKLAELLRSESGGELPKPWYACANKPNYRADFHPTASYYNLHQHDIVRDIKHWMCLFPHYRVGTEYRSVEGLAQLGLILPPRYELPDGTFVDTNYSVCTVAENIFFPEAPVKVADEMQVVTDGDLPPPPPVKPKKRARELLAQPSSEINLEQEALHDLVYLAAGRADVDTRREMLGNIALVGGGAMFGGIQPRLSKELMDVVPSNFKMKFSPALPIERQNAAWIGGSILSICGSFEQLWISKQEYNEYGSSIVPKRFVY